MELRHGACGDVDTGDLGQEGGRLLECEAKIGTAQLRQLPTGPKPSQWQRRVERVTNASRSPGGSRRRRSPTLSRTAGAVIR